MLRLRGSQAYSNFRIQKLLSDVQAVLPNVRSIDTEYQHLATVCNDEQKLDDTELAKLKRLLSYGPKMHEVEHQGQRLFVLPRFGTISPWSTKASDIVAHCGLTKIARVERGIGFYINASSELDPQALALISELIHDPMTESVVSDIAEAQALFRDDPPKPLFEVPLLSQGVEALEAANVELGLALSADEIEYLVAQYNTLEKNPTDVELMMFAQVNSEHCRHKIFNADWVVDGQSKEHSLFRMIRGL